MGVAAGSDPRPEAIIHQTGREEEGKQPPQVTRAQEILAWPGARGIYMSLRVSVVAFNCIDPVTGVTLMLMTYIIYLSPAPGAVLVEGISLVENLYTYV